MFTIVADHRLNMELDLQSLFGLHVTWCAQLYSLAETRLPPIHTAFGLVYTRALLVSQDRRHLLFVTPAHVRIVKVLPTDAQCCRHFTAAHVRIVINAQWRQHFSAAYARRCRSSCGAVDDLAVCPRGSRGRTRRTGGSGRCAHSSGPTQPAPSQPPPDQGENQSCSYHFCDSDDNFLTRNTAK